MFARVKILFIAWVIGIGTFNPQILSSQTSVKGYVFCASDTTPIPGVHITINETVRAISRLPDGFFSMENQFKIKSINASHIAFRQSNTIINDSALIIFMTPYVAQLPQVQINARPYKNIISDKKMYVIDYDFYQGNIIAISFDNRKDRQAKIVMITKSGDTNQSLPVKQPESLFRDCFQNQHLIDNTLAWQIFPDSNLLRLIYPTEKKEFLSIFHHVLGCVGNKFVIRNNHFNNQVVELMLYDRTNGEYQTFALYADEGGLERLSDKARLQSSQGYTIHDARFEEMCFYSEKLIFSFIVDSSIIVFNTLNSSIETYNTEGELVNQIETDFHKDKNWDKIVLRDDVTGLFYTHFTKGGITSLYEIKLDSGETSFCTKIPDLLFTQKIKVHSGKIYFLHNDATNGDYKQLFAMNIEN